MFQILTIIFWQIKIKTKSVNFYYQFLFFIWISFFNLYYLFPNFICTNNIGSQVNSLFEGIIFNPFSSLTFSSSFSSGGISVI